MYASTRDPPEHKEIPICTLKNFPYATEHTLRWAVETFDALFKSRPVDVNAYLSSRDFQDSIRKSPASSRLPILETLHDALLRHRPLRLVCQPTAKSSQYLHKVFPCKMHTIKMKLSPREVS